MNAQVKNEDFVQADIGLLKLGKLITSGELSTTLHTLNLELYELGTDAEEEAKKNKRCTQK